MAYYKCYYCGHVGNNVTHHDDHYYPARLGGVRVVDSCQACNLQKGGKTAQKFARWLLANPEQMLSGIPYPDSNRKPFVRRTLSV